MAGDPRLGGLGDGSPPLGSKGEAPVGGLGEAEAEALSEK